MMPVVQSVAVFTSCWSAIVHSSVTFTVVCAAVVIDVFCHVCLDALGGAMKVLGTMLKA